LLIILPHAVAHDGHFQEERRYKGRHFT